MKPIIGITSSLDETVYKLGRRYIEALARAGCTPVVLPPLTGCDEEILSFTDGLVFSGGGDIHARFFGEGLHEKADSVFTERDEFEISLINKALSAGKPLLCICRGMQALNVACGGSLLQHVEGHVQKEDRHVKTHDIIIEDNSELIKILGRKATGVNSFHHQAVGRLGDGLKTAARSPDGLIEALEHKRGGVIAVQWHPESFVTVNCNIQMKIFEYFVKNVRLR